MSDVVDGGCHEHFWRAARSGVYGARVGQVLMLVKVTAL